MFSFLSPLATKTSVKAQACLVFVECLAFEGSLVFGESAQMVMATKSQNPWLKSFAEMMEYLIP